MKMTVRVLYNNKLINDVKSRVSGYPEIQELNNKIIGWLILLAIYNPVIIIMIDPYHFPGRCQLD